MAVGPGLDRRKNVYQSQICVCAAAIKCSAAFCQEKCCDAAFVVNIFLKVNALGFGVGFVAAKHNFSHGDRRSDANAPK
jgi:hypothetical protein